MSIYGEWITNFRRHFHCKINSLALFLIFLPVIVYGQQGDFDSGYAMNDISTKVAVSVDGGAIYFYTKSFDLESAIADRGIELGEMDVVEPPLDTKLLGGEITVKVTRSVQILVEEDEQKKILRSGYSEPKDILAQNNIKVYPEDKLDMELIFDFFNDKSLGRKITIRRAPVLYVDVDGETKELRSWGQTVGEAIKENGILVGDKDKVEPGLGTYLTNKVAVTITRVAESEVEEVETIPFIETTVEDFNSYIGQNTVQQQGKNGKKKVVYKLTSENGILVDKTILSSEVIEASQSKIISKGVKPYKAGDLWPHIVAASEKYGISATRMYNVMICESGGNPNSVGYNVYGLFQYNLLTWAGASAAAGYGGASIFDPIAQIYVTAYKVARDGSWSAWPSC